MAKIDVVCPSYRAVKSVLLRYTAHTPTEIEENIKRLSSIL